jgi:hypothetical protein
MVKTKIAKDLGKTLDHLISHITDLKEPMDPRDFKQAKMLINDLQALKSKNKGEGIFDTTISTFNRLKDVGSKLIYGRSDLPPKVKKILSQVGDDSIVSAVVYRKPVQSFIQSVIRTVSSYPYDNIFHLSIIFKTNKGQQVLLEKNAAINMDINRTITGAQSMPVVSIPGGLTINKLIENTQKSMGSKFIPYSSSSNNCQDFIFNVLKANQMDNPELVAFIKQDTSMIFKDEKFKKFADTVTGLGEKIDIVAQGGQIMKNKKPSKKNILTNNIMPKKSSKGGAIDLERLIRDTGKYIQPVADAAQDRAIKEIKGNGASFSKKQLLEIISHKNKVIEDLERNAYSKGKGFEDMMRDAGKYLQPVADAAQDRAIKEIRGNGRRVVKGSQEAKDKMQRVRAMKRK